MPRPIVIRTDFSVEILRKLAEVSDNARQQRRLRGIAAIIEGETRAEAAAIGGMDWQTLRDGVCRFNAEGPDGLFDRKQPGGPQKLTTEQRFKLAANIALGPDRRAAGSTARNGWRRAELVALIEERFNTTYCERSVSRLLHTLGLAHLSIRPRHPVKKPPHRGHHSLD